MKRVILMGGVLIAALIAVGVYVLYSSLDTVVQSAVEQVGSDATGTRVTLGEVDISPTSGSGALRQFCMTNPKGFEEGDAFKFEEVSVTIDLSTIASDPVVIKEIVVQAPEITYTIGGGTSNMDEIQKNVDDYATSEEGSGSGGGDGDEGPKLIIEHLYLRDGTVIARAPELSDETVSAPLPEIHLTDIGKDGNGATPGEVARQTMAAVVDSAKSAVGSVEIKALLQDAGEMADEAADQLKKLFE
jgi:uncharacterized protein involved in outer membrane biogenesis